MKLVRYFEKVAERAHSLTKLEISQLASVSLLGSKEVARRIMPILNDQRIKIENIFDNNSARQGLLFESFRVQPLVHTDHKVIVCAYNSNKIIREISGGVDAIAWDHLIAHEAFKKFLPWNCYSLDEHHLFSNIEQYQSIYDRCVDDESRNELLLQIESRYFVSTLEQAPISNELEFCSQKYTNLSAESVILDGGAYNGDTAERFINFCMAQHNVRPHIVCVESDLLSVGRLVEKYALDPGVTILNGFLSSKNSIVSVGLTGEVNNSRQIKTSRTQAGSLVQACTLDQISSIYEINFAKLDIEGGEFDALLGALNLIRTKKCTFAISVYHKVEDLLSLSKFFENGYGFGFSAYAQRPWDSVMYAIPN